MGGKMSPAWWRAYWASHREQLNANRRARRAFLRATDPSWHQKQNDAKRAWRAKQAPAASAIDQAPLPFPYYGHPLLEQARQLAGTFWYGNLLYDATTEDAAGEAVLALLEGRDPKLAIKQFYRRLARTRQFERPLFLKE